MGMTLQEIIIVALALPREERLQLASALLESLPRDSRSAIDAAWNAVAERRLAEITAGKDVLIDGDEAMRQAYAAIHSEDRISEVRSKEQEHIMRLWIEETQTREQLRKDGLLQSRPVEDALADLEARLNEKYPPP
jgi:putative addiction module component (TIGR02574 family)